MKETKKEKNMIVILNIEDRDILKTKKYKSIESLESLSAQLREFLLESVSNTGGHLSSNLGIVELTVALHKVFDSPQDKLIWDVGHQSYIHKILTGRAKDFETLRQFKGLSGFPKRSESEHDVWESGHSSTSLSAALGFAIARDAKKEKGDIIAVIGDASIANGMAFEALNNIGHSSNKVIIILNDNDMSINKNVGALNKSLNRLLINKGMLHTSKQRKSQRKSLYRKMRSSIKHLLLPDNIFDELGISYFGLVDGHDYKSLLQTFKYAKKSPDSVIIHIKTKKGKGYKYAETDKFGFWHGVPKFDLETGQFIDNSKGEKIISWSEFVSNEVLKHAKKDPSIYAITPAMVGGTKLNKFQKELPDRIIDVGIAEEHAATLAAGMALNGMKPYLTYYSTFSQRAYDQIQHDIARQNANVFIGLDRAGIVGADGETHQGIYDIPMLRHIPNITIMMPKDFLEAKAMIESNFDTCGCKVLRYPRGGAMLPSKLKVSAILKRSIKNQEWEILTSGDEINVISFGPNVIALNKALKDANISANVINARFIKPLDTKMLMKILTNKKRTIIHEEGAKIGGFASSILEFCNENKIDSSGIEIFALPDKFIQHGKKDDIMCQYDLETTDIIDFIESLIYE